MGIVAALALLVGYRFLGGADDPAGGAVEPGNLSAATIPEAGDAVSGTPAPSGAPPTSTTTTTSVPAVSQVTVGSVAVPSVVGMALDPAESLLQSVGIDGTRLLDVSGAARSQVWDRNWVVCTQQPAAGDAVGTDAVVTLGLMKADEACP